MAGAVEMMGAVVELVLVGVRVRVRAVIAEARRRRCP